MPAISTPPRLDPEHRLNDGDHGAGRRPPTDKFTGGNGEGDNWQDRPVGSRGPWERLHQSRIGLFFGLCGVAFVFIALVTTFLVTRESSTINAQHQVVNYWRALTLPRILILNTVVLVVSSITAEIARRSMFREIDAMEEWIGLGKPTTKRAMFWLSITLALGIMFLAGQTVAWNQLAALPAYIRTLTSAHLFYIFTGVHAVHSTLR